MYPDADFPLSVCVGYKMLIVPPQSMCPSSWLFGSFRHISSSVKIFIHVFSMHTHPPAILEKSVGQVVPLERQTLTAFPK